MVSRAREVDLPCVTESGWWRTGVLENGTKGRNLLELDQRTLGVCLCVCSHVQGTSLVQKFNFNITIDPRQATTPDLPSSSTT